MMTPHRYVELTGRVIHGEEDEGGFVSYCPELDVASQGETVDEAIASLREAIVTFLTFMDEEGRLMSFLDERGIPVLDTDPPSERTVMAQRGSVVSVMVANVAGGRVALAV